VHTSDGSEADLTVVKAGIGLIGRDGRYLVRLRPPGKVYAGYWEFPGGKCEPGEPPLAATLRECFEETGLLVKVERLRHRTRCRYPHGLVELHFYDCTPLDSTAEPAVETGFLWKGARELAGLRFPEANEAVVEELTRLSEPAG
jgi:8-oxo-dGTP diphosphatase